MTEQSFVSEISLTWIPSFRYFVFFALLVGVNLIHTDFKIYITVIILIFHLCQRVHMTSGTQPDISSLLGLQTCQCCNSRCYFNCYTQNTAYTAQHWDPQRPCLVIFEVLQRFAGFMEGASLPAYRSPVIIEWKTGSMPALECH